MRAANKPRAGTDSRNPVVWTNDDLEKLRSLGLISIVGRMDEEQLTSASAPAPYLETQDPEWYAEQAAQLRDELERRRAKLHEYQKALEDARSLRETTGGINVDEGDTGITPEAGIEFLQQRLNEAQMGLDALEDLARRNDISPGALRGQ
ncbi:MAG: hypothetical protein WAQ77_05050 [Candidatus Acidiferrum sp.]